MIIKQLNLGALIFYRFGIIYEKFNFHFKYYILHLKTTRIFKWCKKTNILINHQSFFFIKSFIILMFQINFIPLSVSGLFYRNNRYIPHISISYFPLDPNKPNKIVYYNFYMSYVYTLIHVQLNFYSSDIISTLVDCIRLVLFALSDHSFYLR